MAHRVPKLRRHATFSLLSGVQDVEELITARRNGSQGCGIGYSIWGKLAQMVNVGFIMWHCHGEGEGQPGSHLEAPAGTLSLRL